MDYVAAEHGKKEAKRILADIDWRVDNVLPSQGTLIE